MGKTTRNKRIKRNKNGYKSTAYELERQRDKSKRKSKNIIMDCDNNEYYGDF